jgi:hypothetical protein
MVLFLVSDQSVLNFDYRGCYLVINISGGCGDGVLSICEGNSAFKMARYSITRDVFSMASGGGRVSFFTITFINCAKLRHLY